MFSKVFLVFFLALALSSSVSRGHPHPQVREQSSPSCPVPTPDTPKKGSIKSSGSPPSNGNPVKGNGKGNQNGNSNNDPQKTLTLDPAVISRGFENDGLKDATLGQVPSLTSSNNFINFCLTVNKPLTNGKQIKTGSCNPCPMGEIPHTRNMPSSKFVSPENFGAVKANTNFTIKMAIEKLEAGNFVNAASNYYAAPQQLNKKGIIIGHTHYVVQAVDSFTSTKALNPNVFAFFKGVNTPADANGIVSVSVDQGLPKGLYRLASINTAANHQPVLAPIAQHGFLDDVIYFSVTKDGKPVTPPGTAADNKNKNKNAEPSPARVKSNDPPPCPVDGTTSNSTTPYVNGKGSKGGKYGVGSK